MKMEVVAVQSFYDVLGSNKVRDWTSTLTPPSAAAAAAASATSNAAAKKSKSSSGSSVNGVNSSSGGSSGIRQQQHSINKSSINYNNNNNNNNNRSSNISSKSNKKPKTSYQDHYSGSSSSSSSRITHSNIPAASSAVPAAAAAATAASAYNNFYCDEYDIDAAAVDELSLRLLDELRAAKSRHLTCTEVSLPCDLTPNIAAEIIRVSAKEPCGIRGCTIYIEFEDEPNNSRRIATLKLDPETVSTFEVYLTLRQDHRGWTALLPQFMKSLARTITISPDFTITKNKLYSTDCDGLRSSRRSYSFGGSTPSAAIATPRASQQSATAAAAAAAAAATTLA